MSQNRPDFKFRFLDVENQFWDYIKDKNITPSEAIRHFIKQGTNEKIGLSIEQNQTLLNEIIQLRKSHSSIGSNLNQVAKYFNMNDHLIEGELHQTHQQLMENQKKITKLLVQILKSL